MARSKVGLIAALFLTLTLSFSAFAKSKKRHQRTKTKANIQYFLTFDQVVALPKKLRRNYLTGLQNVLIGFHKSNQKVSKNRKSQSAWLERGYILQLLASSQAHAEEAKQLCLNAAWLKVEQGCTNDFEVDSDLIKTLPKSIRSQWEIPEDGGCSNGEFLCDPVFVGPGICINAHENKGNETPACIDASQSNDDVKKGLGRLNSSIDTCSGQEKPNYCSELKEEYESRKFNLEDICSVKKMAEGDKRYKAVCLRAWRLLNRTEDSYQELKGTQIPKEQTCKYVHQRVFEKPRSNILCSQLKTCIAVVRGCDFVATAMNVTLKDKSTGFFSEMQQSSRVFQTGSGMINCEPDSKGKCPTKAADCFNKFKNSFQVSIQQRAEEESRVQ